ncbi:hypothetical protein [Kitasatospora sp. NPDC094015]|uniref:hypothetical protein n=1 Tax=Kitasatospora sp. NPDC094015 TaxID=3155205 RepID=UPI00332F8435
MNEEWARIDEGLGHYSAAVAAALVRDGTPVAIFEVDGPRTEELTIWPEGSLGEDGAVPEEIEVVEDARVVLSIGVRFSERLVPGEQCGLGWDPLSGWYFFVGEPHQPREQLMAMARTRWLSDGLVPAPARVVSFLSGVFLDPLSAGSAERPYYRGSVSAPGLVERLAPYVEEPGVVWPAKPGQARYSAAVESMVLERLLACLTEDSPVVQLPVRAGELQALVELLELHDLHGRHFQLVGGLGGRLARDIEGRLRAGAVGVEPSMAVGYAEAIRQRNAAVDAGWEDPEQ